jgi:hypothetical protein
MRTPVALPPFTERCSAMQMRRFIKFLSFSDWLKKAPQLRDEAESSPHDTEEDSTSQLSQADIDAWIDKWTSSPGLRPPE